MPRRIIPLILLLCSTLVFCPSPSRKSGIRWVTIEDLAVSLENQPPMNVAFDIDDTVLFSSPGYYYGQRKYSPGSEDYQAMIEFWEEMNNALDQFSLPKECARRLIAFHVRRGDSIYFITGRQPTETEFLTALLSSIFDLQNPNKVIFVGSSVVENPKIPPLRDLGIQIFYGDSDGDIRAAQSLRIRPIRILRAGNSTHKPLPDFGNLGEEVLRDSQF